MQKFSKILKIILGILVLVFGILTLIDFITKGYNPKDEELMLFSPQFQTLHNAIMESYLGYTIRIIMIVCGSLMLTKKYWFIGLLLYLPVAVNILAMHLFYDLPPAHNFFFGSGILVSVPALLLLWLERKKLKVFID